MEIASGHDRQRLGPLHVEITGPLWCQFDKDAWQLPIGMCLLDALTKVCTLELYPKTHLRAWVDDSHPTFEGSMEEHVLYRCRISTKVSWAEAKVKCLAAHHVKVTGPVATTVKRTRHTFQIAAINPIGGRGFGFGKIRAV